MAERRMFAKTIVLSDAFLDMPLSARCLYFTLGMLADDDGFVNAPKSIMRQCGASNDDMNILLAKRFVLAFDSGVIVIKHWRVNNYLRSDRYTKTKYVEELESLSVDNEGIYHSGIPTGIPPVNQKPTGGIPSIGKDSIGKDSLGKGSKKFTPPTLKEIEEYVKERNSPVDAKRFFEYYESGGWKDGKGQAVKNWKQKLITWEQHDSGRPVKKTFTASSATPSEKTINDLDRLFESL